MWTNKENQTSRGPYHKLLEETKGIRHSQWCKTRG